MFRTVIPVAVAAVTRAYVVIADVIDVVKIVVVIDIDVDAAAPAATITPAAAPHGAHRHTDSKGNRKARRVVVGGRVVNRRIRVNIR